MASRKWPLGVSVLAALPWFVPLPAEDPQQPARARLLPEASEIELALSAAPKHLRDGAGVYVLRAQGFVRERESRNGFTCIVNRDHPLSRKPVCYDAEGTTTVLPVVLREGELLMKGMRPEKIRAEIAAGFRDGKFISPRRPGVAYMLSHDALEFDARARRAVPFPPRIMFYAPNLTNQDIGSTGNGADGLPFIADSGHQALMIVIPRPDRAKRSVEQSATGTTSNE